MRWSESTAAAQLKGWPIDPFDVYDFGVLFGKDEG